MTQVFSMPKSNSTPQATVRKIPVNIITGFLGTGKTTSIQHLLKEKPADGNWAVLVNEFGEIGIDGAILTESGALIKEVPGGCMCCTAGVPTAVALTSLLRMKPDRLIIEPTGLGHPHKIIALLKSAQFKDYIDLKATVAMVDPRNLSNPKYTENQNFNDQLAVADIVIANKADLCGEDDINAFKNWLSNCKPTKIDGIVASNGKFPVEVLENEMQAVTCGSVASHHHQHAEDEPQFQLPPNQLFIRKENKGQNHFSCGWIFGAEVSFNFDGLFTLFSELTAERTKAVVNTTNGAYIFNVVNGMVSVNETELSGLESRIEVIDSQLMPWDELEVILFELAGIE